MAVSFFPPGEIAGIPISTWMAEEEDDALLRLVPLLKDVAKAADVRTVLREEIGLARSISEYKANAPT